MAIKGHKERALLRRGYHVQESLQRRINLNENHSLRRQVVEAMGGDDSDYYIKFSELCKKDKTKSGSQAYCLISELLDDLNATGNPKLADEVYQSLITINEFFKSIRLVRGQGELNSVKRRRDDKQLFKKTILSIFKNENPANSFKLVANFIKDPAYDKDEVKRALLDYRSVEKGIKQSELEEFLKKARFKEYSKYENSFKGGNFDLLKGKSVLSHGYLKQSGKPETFFNVIKMLYDLLETQSFENYEIVLNEFIRNIANGVLNTDIEDLIYKSDLQVLEDLLVDDEVILQKGSYVEVKKFDLGMDSYFSEYFAIYKNEKKLPKITKTIKFRDLYNKVVDGVFNIVKNEGQFMIKKISDNIDAVMYDKNRIVLKDDIEFYWSNKGQRDCNDKRLSIRFRIKNSNITVYQYDSKTHSNQLVPLDVTGLSVKSKTFCQ